MSEGLSFAQSLLSKISADEHTIIQFFAVFSRFEYSLKRSDYLKERGNRFEADWNKFAGDLKEYFDENRSSQLCDAVDYLVKHPPKKQISATDWQKLVWDGREPILQWLLVDAICRVRNNLFHGGKYYTGSVFDPARDQKLLEYSLCILEECLCLEAEPAKKVRDYFKGSLE